jgi:hypothetical protein
MKKQVFVFRRFAHRRNADASFDSICLTCFLTVGSAMVDGALQDSESAHRCKPWSLNNCRSAPAPYLAPHSRVPKEAI